MPTNHQRARWLLGLLSLSLSSGLLDKLLASLSMLLAVLDQGRFALLLDREFQRPWPPLPGLARRRRMVS